MIKSGIVLIYHVFVRSLRFMERFLHRFSARTKETRFRRSDFLSATGPNLLSACIISRFGSSFAVLAALFKVSDAAQGPLARNSGST